MGLYNFKPQFEKPILDRSKNHTIRALRAHPDVPGNKLYLYVGLRTKNARRLAVVRCSHVDEIRITSFLPGGILVNGEPLTWDEMKRLAVADGFAGIVEMARFWEGRLPFVGQIIHWRHET